MSPARNRRRRGARALGALVVATAGVGVFAGGASAATTAQVANQTLRITGDGTAERIALRLQAGVPGTLQIDLGDDGSANLSFDRSKFTKILVDAGGGDDAVRIDEANGAFTNQEATTINGQAGNDSLVGGSSAEALNGGDGDDLVDGDRGDDPKLTGGAGADTFVWNPGDGSDGLDGGADADVMDFNGAPVGEKIAASASAGKLTLTRDIAGVTMTARLVERVDLAVLGGADDVSVGSLAASAVTRFDLDLAGPVGGGDAAPDLVRVFGTGGPDNVQVSASGTSVVVGGLAAELHLAAPEGGSDSLVVSTEGGTDSVGANGNLAALVRLTADGGLGRDTLFGSNGADVLIGGDGNDAIDGQQGNDVAFLGAGEDTFTWDPGDGSDTVEGQDGADAMVFNGSGGSELMELSANGPRVRFTRNIGAIVMDLDDVERLEVEALGGADTIIAGDVSGTDLTTTDVDLEGVLGGAAGDGQPDSVVVTGTNGDDAIAVADPAAPSACSACSPV